MNNTNYRISASEQLEAIQYLAENGTLSNYLSEDGKMDTDAIWGAVNEMNKRKLLEQHPYTITKLANGRWQTFLPADGKHKKKQIRRVDKDDLESVAAIVKGKHIRVINGKRKTCVPDCRVQHIRFAWRRGCEVRKEQFKHFPPLQSFSSDTFRKN